MGPTVKQRCRSIHFVKTSAKRRYAPRLPPEQRRVQLLDAAFEVIGRIGLSELNMEAVATEAGVGKPVLYTVFRTRTELVAALLDREHRRALQPKPLQPFHNKWSQDAMTATHFR